MFTLSDIRDIAVQIERNGEATYRLASKTAPSTQVAEVLVKMADDEQKHLQWFENLSGGVQITPEDQQIIEMGQALLRGMLENQTFSLDSDRLAAENNVEQIISQAVEFEHDTILFYEMLRGFIDKPEVAAHLDDIIAEERTHIDQLNRMIPAPSEEVEGERLS